MKNRIILVLGAAALLGAGCERKTPVVYEPVPAVPPNPPVARTETFETHALRKAINAYEVEPTAVQAARVKKAFAEVDGEIAELMEHVLKKVGESRAEAGHKLADLRAYRAAEEVRFRKLEALAPLDGQPVRTVPREGTAEKVGEAIDDAARKLDEKAREAVDEIREKLK